MNSLVGEEIFYLNFDFLRNLLIFYFGYLVVFYINKLIYVELLENYINFNYEILFELGVNLEKLEELN